MTKDVPWEYSANASLRLWRWLTPHFEATIKSDGNRFIFSVSDLTRQRRIPLVNDYAKDFQEAERKVRECVGKSYPPSTGYRDYAGSLATTFTISDGTSIDFGQFEGDRVSMIVMTPDGEITASGSLVVDHHTILVKNDTNVFKIPPLLIVSVKSEDTLKTVSPASSKPKSRTVSGSHKPGCTGTAGFLPNTVEHARSAPWCPVHRV